MGTRPPPPPPTKYSVFGLPPSLLDQLVHVQGGHVEVAVEFPPTFDDAKDNSNDTNNTDDARGFSCVTCSIASFASVAEQRSHAKSAWHAENVRRRVARKDTLEEQDFLNSNSANSDSDSDSDAEEKEDKESTLETDEVVVGFEDAAKGSPWIALPVGTTAQALFVYKQLLVQKRVDSSVNLLAELRLLQVPSTWVLIMFSAGHFAAAVFEAANTKQPVLLEHKSLHRYTTRRKQGGAQSASDNAKGKANSAGSNLRRHNEMMLQQDIQTLLQSWSNYLQSSTRIFIRCPPRNARKIVFFNDQLLTSTDPRIRGFPFITHRPTTSELTRAFTELTTVTVRDYTPPTPATNPSSPATAIKSLAVSSPSPASPVQPPKLLPPPEPFPKLIDFAKRNKLDLFTSTLEKHLSSNPSPPLPDLLNTLLDPAHGTTLLHIASASNAPEIVTYLLTSGANPTLREPTGKQRPPYLLAETKEVRDAFRRAYASDTTNLYNWVQDAMVPSPLTPALELAQKEKEREKKRRQKARQKESLDIRAKELAAAQELEAAQREKEAQERVERAKKGSVFSRLAKAEREAIGMTPERRMQLDREKRALAAEARFRAQQGKCSNCGVVLNPASTFEKFQYKYCSMDCVGNQIVLHN
ncbi:hypothetical protein HDU79_004405 [Rhizoclosmatium sp. JEL0117]|nr:hypothetical protein HDU79_004405 [Rhizoclosmatium sp. JEL0117]